MDLDTKQIIKENYPPDFWTNNFSESLIESFCAYLFDKFINKFSLFFMELPDQVKHAF